MPGSSPHGSQWSPVHHCLLITSARPPPKRKPRLVPRRKMETPLPALTPHGLCPLSPCARTTSGLELGRDANCPRLALLPTNRVQLQAGPQAGCVCLCATQSECFACRDYTSRVIEWAVEFENSCEFSATSHKHPRTHEIALSFTPLPLALDPIPTTHSSLIRPPFLTPPHLHSHARLSRPLHRDHPPPFVVRGSVHGSAGVQRICRAVLKDLRQGRVRNHPQLVCLQSAWRTGDQPSQRHPNPVEGWYQGLHARCLRYPFQRPQ